MDNSLTTKQLVSAVQNLQRQMSEFVVALEKLQRKTNALASQLATLRTRRF